MSRPMRGQGNGPARAKTIKRLRRMRVHLNETPENLMGVRPEHEEIFGFRNFRQAAREWFRRCPF